MRSPTPVNQKKSHHVHSGIRAKKKEGVSSRAVSSSKISSPYTKKIKRSLKRGAKGLLLSPMFHGLVKVATILIIISTFVYVSYRVIGKTFANEVIISKSEIIARVGKLTPLPHEEPYELVRVQDEEDLRKQNPFYKDIKEGNYIIMYPSMAIIYDLRTNTIISAKKIEASSTKDFKGSF